MELIFTSSLDTGISPLAQSVVDNVLATCNYALDLGEPVMGTNPVLALFLQLPKLRAQLRWFLVC